jgi:hypothetical protein
LEWPIHITTYATSQCCNVALLKASPHRVPSPTHVSESEHGGMKTKSQFFKPQETIKVRS